MFTPAFVSSWNKGGRIGRNQTKPSTCIHGPSMRLLSHEKIEVISNSEFTERAKYKFEIEIPAKLSKERRRQSIQSIKQKANFPGFRKGTIPPFVMKDVKGFVLRDCIDELLERAINELELNKIDEDTPDLEMDVDGMLKTFTVGEDFKFSCQLSLQKVLDTDDYDVPEPVITIDPNQKDVLLSAEDSS